MSRQSSPHRPVAAPGIERVEWDDSHPYGHVGEIHDFPHPSQFQPGWNPKNPYFSILANGTGLDHVGGGDPAAAARRGKRCLPGLPLDSSQIRPPCRSDDALLIAKPSPAPERGTVRAPKRSNQLRVLLGDSQPWSRIWMCARLPTSLRADGRWAPPGNSESRWE